ncbi:MAG TPA: AsmA family protein [Terriglobales bacterium]|nr:AsmA family protein [Terriglobales bacterium]
MNTKILKIVGIVIAVLIVVAIALPFLVDVNRFKPEIESNASAALGRKVTLGNLSLSILSGSVAANQLSIADDPKFSNTSFIQAKALKVGVELIPLIFSKQINVTHLVIEHPQISLLRNREGVWNYSSLGNQAGAKTSEKNSSSSPQNLSVGKLEISDGTISLGSVPPRRAPVVYDKVNVTVKDFSFASSFPVKVSAELPGGGSLNLEATAGPINATDTSLTPLDGTVKLTKLDLARSALVNPETGIAGTADFDGKVNSDGHIAKASGTVKASGLKLVPKGSPSPQTVKVVFAVNHDLQKETGELTQGDVSIGKAAMKLTGTYEMKGEETSVHLKLNGQGLPVDDLEALLPAVGVSLPSGSKLKDGTLNLNFDANGPVEKVVATGSVRMSNAKLEGFSLTSKLSAIPGLGGKGGNDTEIQNLSSDVRYAPDGIRLDKMDVVVPSIGTVTGDGTVSPNNELDFKLMANLSGAVGGGLTKAVGGGSGIPVKVGGTTSNPTFMPDMKALATGQLKNLGNIGNAGKSLGKVGGLFGKKKN